MVETGEGESESVSATMGVGVHRDDVDLAEGRIVVGGRMDLRPAEADESPVDLEQAESLGVEPRLGHAAGEIVAGPVTLIGMPVECAIVELEEGVGVMVGVERPRGGDGSVDGERKFDPQLVDASLQDEPGRRRRVVVVVGGGVGLEGHEASGVVVDGVAHGREPTGARRYRPGAMGRPRTPKGRAREVLARLDVEYPDAACELDHRNAYELLAATILSAQCTDVRVNMVTPALFDRFPSPEDLAVADPAEVEELVRSTGFYRNKARSLIGMAQALCDRYDGEVPGEMADLVTVPGVGRKTANVVRSVAMDLPGLPVDTHVGRLSIRLGLTTETDPVKVEHALGAMIPPADWGRFSLLLILHGRRVCAARRTRCDECVLSDICPSSTA